MAANDNDADKTTSIWWAFMWRYSLVSVIVGFCAGLVAGLFLAIVRMPNLIGPVSLLIGFLVSFPVSFWAMKVTLSKSYGPFVIALVRQDTAQPASR